MVTRPQYRRLFRAFVRWDTMSRAIRCRDMSDMSSRAQTKRVLWCAAVRMMRAKLAGAWHTWLVKTLTRINIRVPAASLEHLMLTQIIVRPQKQSLLRAFVRWDSMTRAIRRDVSAVSRATARTQRRILWCAAMRMMRSKSAAAWRAWLLCTSRRTIFLPPPSQRDLRTAVRRVLLRIEVCHNHSFSACHLVHHLRAL